MSTLVAGNVLNNRYRIVKVIAIGGFGRIYRAWDMILHRAVAVKENLDTFPAAQQQFHREALILANLKHTNLAGVLDYFVISGQGQYLVMDFIEGQDLQEMLEQSGPLPLEQALTWISQVCSALKYLHAQNPPVIHRDIKPANIKITKEGKAVLVDFGIAKLYDPASKTTVGARAVTPGYSPPEQYGQGPTDVRSDIYALGATLYTLLTGQVPPESVQISAEQATLLPVRSYSSAVSAVVETAIRGAMNTRPTGRYQLIAEFQAALHATQPAPPGMRVNGGKTSWSLPRLSLQQLKNMGGILLAILVITGLSYFNLKEQGQPEPTRTPQIASPVGYILFTSDRDGGDEIYRMTNTGGIVRLTHTLGGGSSFGLVPDLGGYIFYVSTQEGNREIYRLDRDGNVTRVTHTINGESKDPANDPNGFLLFSSNRDGKYEIYRMDRNGQISQVTHTPGTAESWGPAIDGAGNLIFTSNRGGKREIYCLEQGGKAIRLTTTAGLAESHSPIADPSGYIIFVSNRDGKDEIYRMAWDGQVTRVTNTPGNYESWQPAMDKLGYLLFTSNRDEKKEVYRLELGGKSTRITNTQGDAGSWGAVSDR